MTSQSAYVSRPGCGPLRELNGTRTEPRSATVPHVTPAGVVEQRGQIPYAVLKIFRYVHAACRE